MQKNDFAVFVELWNIQQSFKTPLIHTKMANWLQHAWEAGDTRLLMMAFRASGKSTIVGLFAAWLLWRAPDLRILVLAADSSLSGKMVRDVRKIIERHPLTVDMIPTQLDQWASNRFTVRRAKQLRDPSMLGAGVLSNITGSRADIIIYDDVEVPNTCSSVEKREALRHRLRESNFVLVPKGTQIYVGTPHSYFSIYADQPRKEINEEKTFLENFKRFEQPLLDKNNQSVWPEHYGEKDIQLLKIQSGPQKFASQMMLDPVNIIESRLNIELLRFYEENLKYYEANNQTVLSVGERKIISCSAWWDPAFGSAQGDDSVLAVLFTDEEGYYYLHHLAYLSVTDEHEEDEATAQCQLVVEKISSFHVPSVTIEINGIGKFLPAILRRELAKKNIPSSVVEHTSAKPKNQRILESFDAVLAAEKLYLHEDIRNTPFIREMMDWNPGTKNNKDDGLDAVAGALAQEPIRIKRLYANALRKWSAGSMVHTAETNFEV